MTKMIPKAKTRKTKKPKSPKKKPKKGKPKIKLSTLEYYKTIEHYESKIHIFFSVLFPAYLMIRIKSYEKQKESMSKEKKRQLENKIKLLNDSHDRIRPIHTAFMTCFHKIKKRQYKRRMMINFLRLCELYLNVDVNIHKRKSHVIHDLKAKLFPTRSIREENCSVLTSDNIEKICKQTIALKGVRRRDPKRHNEIMQKTNEAIDQLLKFNS